MGSCTESFFANHGLKHCAVGNQHAKLLQNQAVVPHRDRKFAFLAKMSQGLQVLQLAEAVDPKEVGQPDEAASVDGEQILVVFLQFLINCDYNMVV